MSTKRSCVAMLFSSGLQASCHGNIMLWQDQWQHWQLSCDLWCSTCGWSSWKTIQCNLLHWGNTDYVKMTWDHHYRLWPCVIANLNAPHKTNVLTSVFLFFIFRGAHACWWSAHQACLIRNTWLLLTLLIVEDTVRVFMSLLLHFIYFFVCYRTTV